jgi:pantothenate kinase-related protein Tda10
MEKKNLVITISGPTASGKSRLTYMLKKFLMESGFEVRQEFNIDHSTEDHFDKAMSRKLTERVDKIKKLSYITLKESRTK